MAIVEFGALVTDLVGSIEGFTFQRNRAGAIVRKKPQQRKSATPKQTLEQSAFVDQIQAFQALSIGDKLAWDAFSIINSKQNRFGQEKLLTGQNWFTAVNAARARLGLMQLDTPPANLLPEAILGFNLVVDATKIEINTIRPNNPTDTDIFIDTTFPVSQTTKLQRSAFRKTTEAGPGAFGTIDLTSDWEAAHGLSWPPSGLANCINIAVRLTPVRRSTGITGVGLVVVGGIDFVGSGIDFMEIGSTFIVT